MSQIVYNPEDSKSAPILVIFQKDGQPDDTLSITLLDSGNFSIVLTQNSNRSRVENIVGYFELNRYLRHLFNSFKYDNDTYEYFQFNVPSYSSVVVNIADLNKYLTTVFFSQLKFLNRNWPSEIIGYKPVEQVEQAENEDENLMEEDEEEQEEEQEEEPEPSFFSCQRLTRSKARATQ